jgi:hypothetical protein
MVLNLVLWEQMEEKRTEAGKGWGVRTCYTKLRRMGCACLGLLTLQEGCHPGCFSGLLVSDEDTSIQVPEAGHHEILLVLLSSFLLHLITHQVQL